MRRLRPSFIHFAFSIVALGAIVHGCGSNADQEPQSVVTGGSGGSSDASLGGSGGAPVIDSGIDVQQCDDPTDTDGDGIADELEGSQDTDKDGTPDDLDTDSDNDGMPDGDEAENPALPSGTPGKQRSSACSPVADTDGDGIPDFKDADSDGDGISDQSEASDCASSEGCAYALDCDGDSVIDIVEQAAGASWCDANDVPADAGLYFVVPYDDPEQSKKFDFSTGIHEADIYFLVDTTDSMQPAIDNIKTSLDTKIIPTILNGDPNANPPIPAIPGAWIGVGDFKDVPFGSYGVPGDHVYRYKYGIGGNWVLGNVSPPVPVGASYAAPDNVKQILNALGATGGGDAPESTTQALFMAAGTEQYSLGGQGAWPLNGVPLPPECDSPQQVGRACFRPGKLPVFTIITDAPFHNGSNPAYDYTPPKAINTKPYADVVTKLNQIGAKIVGVSVATQQSGGQARFDLVDLAKKTGSEYYEPAFGGSVKPLVTEKDTATGDVSTEVVRLIGKLVGQGLNNVTTKTTSYDCAGGVDCTGDGAVDAEYHNFLDPQTTQPFDASQLITKVVPVAVPTNPKPYTSIDATTFYGVRGDASVEFEVFARNTVLKPQALTVVRAILRVQTPGGQALGGPDGVKVIYLVIPPYSIVPA